jgi:hypothetical protein
MLDSDQKLNKLKTEPGGPWTLTIEARRLKMEPKSAYRLTDSLHFEEELDPDADPH